MNTSQTELPPGPAQLLADAVAINPSSPRLSDRTIEADTTDDSAVQSRSESPYTDGENDRPRTTTVVTSITDGDPQTQTFTHYNSSAVDAQFSHKDGSVTLRPVPARGLSSSQVKTRRTKSAFEPRVSHFDRNNSDSATNSFRGFYTLFWLLCFVSMARAGVRHWNEGGGAIFGLSFARLIGRDGLALALSDAVMVSSTFLCVPFAKLLQSGWLRYRGPGMIIQHVAQTAFLAISVRWTFHREWPWVQSGFLVLHTLTMLMKIHSYCAYNGELSEISRQLRRLGPELDSALTEHGGREQAEKEAREAWEDALRRNSGDVSKTLESSTVHHKQLAAALNRDVSGLRQRGKRRPTDASKMNATAKKAGDAPFEGLQTLTWHPAEVISSLAINMTSLNEALTSTGVARIRWPDNISLYNFLDYLLIPTLVYHLEYPRTNVIRPVYVLEKVVALFGTFSILILICEHYIIPVYPKEGDSFLQNALDLALPFMINYLLIFYLIFECVCNIFAELTFFADRGFFSDWWNSTTFDEFSRRWNVPVHTFLLRHVYSSTISAYGFSKFQAAFTTFLLSACVHELVMAVAMKKIRLYLFLMQMAQLPLIMIGRLPVLRKYPALGNLFFWLGLLSGFPLLAVCYIRF